MPDIHQNGDDLLSIELDDPLQRHAIANTLLNSDQWIEVVPGMQSVVVQYDNADMSVDSAIAALEAQLETVKSCDSESQPVLQIPVCYGGVYGPDFAPVCEVLGLAADEFIGLHTGQELSVDMLGFTPGFAYVGGLPEALDVPRLSEPRVRVAEGSIGIAKRQSGIYALEGPGGWPIIGRTPVRLFDRSATDPFVVTAGRNVRFVAIDETEFVRMIES